MHSLNLYLDSGVILLISRILNEGFKNVLYYKAER